MFHIMRNTTPFGTRDLVGRFMEALRTAIPFGIENRVDAADWRAGAGEPGAAAVVPWTVDGARISLALTVLVEPPTRAPAPPPASRRGGETRVIVSTYLSPSVQAALDQEGWSYWDSTGNMSLLIREPLITVRREGARRNPEPSSESRALGSLKGRAASQVLVHLLTSGGGTTVRDISRQLKVGLGTVSRVVSLLRDENLFEPTGGGPIVLDDRIAVAHRWAEDYNFAKTFKARRYYSRLGDQSAVDRITRSGVNYAFTGLRVSSAWFAANDRTSPLPADDAWVYTDDAAALIKEADLAPDARRGSIWVAETDVFLPGREGTSGITAERQVVPWRAVGDLLSTPGRHAAAGDELARMLAAKEGAWRPTNP